MDLSSASTEINSQNRFDYSHDSPFLCLLNLILIKMLIQRLLTSNVNKKKKTPLLFPDSPLWNTIAELKEKI